MWLHKQEEFWDEYSQEFRCTLWGTEAGFSISYHNDGQDCQEVLPRYAEAADRCIGWLDAHQAEVFAAIDQEGLYDYVPDWLDGLETVEEDGITYAVLYDDSRLSLPYRKEDFFASIVPGWLSFSADHKSTSFILDMFLNVEPDIFAGHSIEVFVDGDFGSAAADYKITVNGLAG